MWPIGDIRSFSGFGSGCWEGWRYVGCMTSSSCCCGEADVDRTNFFGESGQCVVNM